MNKLNQKGYVALVSVLVILAVGIIVGVTVSMNAINEMQMGFTSTQADKAFVIADACAEESLLRLKREESPPVELFFEDGSCTIYIIALNDDRTVMVTGTVDDYNSLIQMEVTLAPDFVVNSWQEVGEFDY